MIDWVDVLRRLMHTYNVKTQGELSMAMGVPVSVGIDADIQMTGIPWKVLERAVMGKRITWNWLLTGKEAMWAGEEVVDVDVEEAFNEEAAQARERAAKIETRELARQLLYDKNRPAGGASPSEPAPESAASEPVNSAAIVESLEDVKATLQREIARVERLLRPDR